MLHDLQGRADLNGAFGVCVSWEAGAGRYEVDIDGGGRVALKPGNVQAVPPPPPKPSYHGSL